MGFLKKLFGGSTKPPSTKAPTAEATRSVINQRDADPSLRIENADTTPNKTSDASDHKERCPQCGKVADLIPVRSFMGPKLKHPQLCMDCAFKL